MYTTENAEIKAEMPEDTRNMNAGQILNLLGKRWSMEFVDIEENGEHQTRKSPQNKTTAYASAVGDALFDPTDWKAPCYAIHPQCGNEWAKAVFIWYHAGVPEETGRGVISPQGYMAW